MKKFKGYFEEGRWGCLKSAPKEVKETVKTLCSISHQILMETLVEGSKGKEDREKVEELSDRIKAITCLIPSPEGGGLSDEMSKAAGYLPTKCFYEEIFVELPHGIVLEIRMFENDFNLIFFPCDVLKRLKEATERDKEIDEVLQREEEAGQYC